MVGSKGGYRLHCTVTDNGNPHMGTGSWCFLNGKQKYMISAFKALFLYNLGFHYFFYFLFMLGFLPSMLQLSEAGLVW